MEGYTKKRIASIIAVAVSISILLSAMTIYRTEILDSNKEHKNQLTSNIIEKNTIEGPIVDRHGVPICEANEPGIPGEVKNPLAFSSIIGYSSLIYSKSGLRETYKDYLYNGTHDGIGAQLTLTIDSSIQQECSALLGSNEGSITVMNASTGEILALASRSSADTEYNVNAIDEKFSEYNKIDSFFLNRATLAEDPPGSTFKIVTATAMLDNELKNFTYYDNGRFSEYGQNISNYSNTVWGKTDLEKALNKSINTYFASAAIEVGGKNLSEAAKSYMIGEDIELDFCTLKSNYGVENVNDLGLLAQTGFGQGRLVVTPLQLCTMIGAITNDGIMMKPYMVAEITDDDKIIKTTNPEELSRIGKKSSTVQTLKEYLNSTAEGYEIARNDGLVISKTGTAEVLKYPTANAIIYHKYLVVGYEPYNSNQKFAICIDIKNTENPNYEMKQRFAAPLLDFLSQVTL